MTPPLLLNANGLIEESKTEEPPKVDNSTHLTAFMILIDNEGNYIFEPDINKPVIPKRKATASEVKGSMSSLLAEIQSQDTAVLAAELASNAVINKQMAMAKQAYDAQQNQKLLTGLQGIPK